MGWWSVRGRCEQHVETLSSKTAKRSERSMVKAAIVRTGLFLTSLALLLIELTLTRIFSVTLGNHFAFLVISIAIFRLSLAGVIVYVMPNSSPRPVLARK